MILDHKRFDLYDKMIFEKARLKPPFTMANPMPDEACFLYVLSGEQRTHSATVIKHLKSKDAILMKCGSYYAEWLTGAGYDECEAIAVHFYPEVLRRIYETEVPGFIKNLRKVENDTNMYVLSGEVLIDAYIQSMKFYFENPNLVDEDLLVLKLKELILLLLKTEKRSSIIDLIASLFSPRVYGFKEVIDTHVYSNLSVDELAGLTNLSVSSFKREFTKIYNDSPAHYLKSKKLGRAAERLLVSDARISDIAFECGFNDLAHFSKSFQEKFNISPSAFRMSQTNKSLDELKKGLT